VGGQIQDFRFSAKSQYSGKHSIYTLMGSNSAVAVTFNIALSEAPLSHSLTSQVQALHEHFCQSTLPFFGDKQGRNIIGVLNTPVRLLFMKEVPSFKWRERVVERRSRNPSTGRLATGPAPTLLRALYTRHSPSDATRPVPPQARTSPVINKCLLPVT
jgi:hypothetical protein